MTRKATWGWVVGTVVLVMATLAYAAAPATVPTVLITDPLTGDNSRVVRLINVQLPAGADSGRHHHPGDQYTTVQEGEVQITMDGQPPHIYKAGEVAHIPPLVVHRTVNVSGKPARTLEVFIVAKDKPNTVKDE